MGKRPTHSHAKFCRIPLPTPRGLSGQLTSHLPQLGKEKLRTTPVSKILRLFLSRVLGCHSRTNLRAIGHFRVAFYPIFKTSPRAKPQ